MLGSLRRCSWSAPPGCPRAPLTPKAWTSCRCGGRRVAARLALTFSDMRACKPARPDTPQIPFTHPPVGLPIAVPRRKARQQRVLGATAAVDAPPAAEPTAPRFQGVPYCHAFAEGRPCRAKGRCAFPHLSLADVEQAAQQRADWGGGAGAQGWSNYVQQIAAFVQTKRGRTER